MRQVVRPNQAGKFPQVTSFSDFFGEVALGNGTQYKIFIAQKGDWHIVAVLGYGAYQFQGYVHSDYAGDKLGVKNKADAANLADFINAQTLGQDYNVQGAYDGMFCEDLAPRYS